MRALKSFTCLAILAVFFAFAAPAGAHTASVSGVASCSDGAHLVTWTIGNSQPRKTMTIINATSTAVGVVYPVAVDTNPVPEGGSTEATTVVPGGVIGSITITIVVTWPNGPTKTFTVTVGLPVDCSTTGTTSPPTTAPPTSAPPTTAPPTTPTSVGVSPSTITPTSAPAGVGGVESGPGLAATGSSGTGTTVAVGLGLMLVGAGLVALRRRPAR